ncbi:MAG: AmmeMemoRadiSam system radical SAM enzyme [Thermoprotei archaeon]|nr:MAG: AmmeMemoRadiSam system radical SAM enzyme [Thermoprotei archaeon]
MMSIDKPTIRKSPLYVKLKNDRVECRVCERRCKISPGGKGYCKTRVNWKGDLYTLTYGDLSAVESRPIEIKPFFHFWPGSTAITISTWSCNFPCPWCQNWHISRTLPNPETASYTPPEYIISKAVEYGDEGTCVSFNEPIMLFEYSLDLFKEAKEKGLYNTYVSNGYMTIEALDLLIKNGLDGLKIDVKGDLEIYKRVLNADGTIPWRNAEYALEHGVHVEIVCLLVTGISDSELIIDWIIEEHLKRLGPETPIHFTRYYPAYRYREPPTKIDKLEYAYKKARREGILFPYIGNVAGHPYENTYCPNCGNAVIKRYGYSIVKYRLTEDKKCEYCGTRIPIKGKLIQK